ncbi:MAG: sugar phosphate isomerase/epimerase [Clostridia bacterium]|nr:sugar phosphate isomerase/epimerase [Clostridia bacterium]
MKIGVTSYSFNNYVNQTGANLLSLCDKAKELGFDYIDFTAIKTDNPLKTAKELNEYCKKIGLEIVAYTVGANFLADDINKEVQRLKEEINVCKALGAKIFRHDVCYKLKTTPNYDYKSAIQEMTPYIKELTLYAKSLGIETCSENHGFIFQSPNRVEELILSVNEKNYGWLLDIGNFLCDDVSPELGTIAALKYLKHVHVKDFLFKSSTEKMPNGYQITTNGGNFLRGTILGHGVVPVEKCINILKNYGYNGTLTIEFEGLEDNISALKLGLEYLKTII